MLEGQNILVLDLETLHSADDCRFCHVHKRDWGGMSCGEDTGVGTQIRFQHEAIGWQAHALLGLSIGCYFDYADGEYHFFDLSTLIATVQTCVTRQPLLVSYNGIQFDFSLMRGIIRQWADNGVLLVDESHASLTALCDAFKVLAQESYDVLAQIWAVDPGNRFQKGNGLDAVSQANGYGAKAMDGATAPVLWREGRVAEVINYCMADVRKTKQLFEQVLRGEPLQRPAGPVTLPIPYWGV